MNGADGTTTCLHSSARDGSVVVFDDFSYDVSKSLTRIFELPFKLLSSSSHMYPLFTFCNSYFIVHFKSSWTYCGNEVREKATVVIYAMHPRGVTYFDEFNRHS